MTRAVLPCPTILQVFINAMLVITIRQNALGNMISIQGGKAASETSLVLTDFLQLRKNTIFKSETMLTETRSLNT